MIFAFLALVAISLHNTQEGRDLEGVTYMCGIVGIIEILTELLVLSKYLL